MITRRIPLFSTLLLVLAGSAGLRAQETAFTYQGRLSAQDQPANGVYDFQFALFDADTGGATVAGPVTNLTVHVTGGLFTLALDFGAEVFSGAPRWLALGVRTNGGGNFTALSPRQPLLPVPRALVADRANALLGTLPSAALAGTYGSPVALLNPGNSFAGNGAGLSGLTASELTTGTLPDERLSANVARLDQVWLRGGNGGTIPGSDLLGTTDNQALELSVNGERALRLEPTPSLAPNLIGGSANNFVAPGITGATIGGGGGRDYSDFNYTNSIAASFGTVAGGYQNAIERDAGAATIGGGYFNTVQPDASFATIAGGSGNTIQTNAGYSTIGGGQDNTIQTGASSATTSGGTGNAIQTGAYLATIGGGFGNRVESNAYYGTVGGGSFNKVQVNSPSATIAGGFDNNVQAGAGYAMIPGGRLNTAAGYAFAAGHRAKAVHTGAFVWGDSTNADVSSTNANSVTFRAAGGVRLFTDGAATAGVTLAPGSTAWSVLSDREAKKDFVPADGQEVLDKLAAVPVQYWHYRWESSDATPHLGPTAQDFKQAFYPGRDERSITTQEIDGVALAAIQGLNARLEQREAALRTELAVKSDEIEALRRTVAELERLIRQRE